MKISITDTDVIFTVIDRLAESEHELLKKHVNDGYYSWLQHATENIVKKLDPNNELDSIDAERLTIVIKKEILPEHAKTVFRKSCDKILDDIK